MQDANKIKKVHENSIIKEGVYSNRVYLMDDEKIIIVASKTIDLIDYSNIHDLKLIFSSNFE